MSRPVRRSAKRGGGKLKAASRKPIAGSRKPAAGSRKPKAASRKPKAGSRKPAAGSRTPTAVSAKQIDAIRKQIETVATRPPRWNANPDEVRRAVLKLVLTLVELIRQLLERQAIRRMEGGSLSDQQVEEMGLALMKLEEKIREMADQFGLKPEDLNLDLGPLGKLLE